MARVVLNNAQIARLKTHLVQTIVEAQSDLLERYPVHRYASALDSHRLYGRYKDVPAEIQQRCQEMTSQVSPHILENYHKLVMLHFIENFAIRARPRNIPQSIMHLFVLQFQRIISEMEIEREGFYTYPNDAFMKDLGLCRLKLYPCGAELLDELSGIQRSVLFKNGSKQFLQGILFFLLKNNGFRPYYELHMHAPLRKEFTAEGWTACYVRIAELLQMNPHMKGVSCVSWWYDPQLETISPHLRYLRRDPLAHGAQIFYVAPDPEAAYGATEASATRRRLYEAGTYMPQLYLMVWARHDLIKWAHQLTASAE